MDLVRGRQPAPSLNPSGKESRKEVKQHASMKPVVQVQLTSLRKVQVELPELKQQYMVALKNGFQRRQRLKVSKRPIKQYLIMYLRRFWQEK
eukprot:2403227-Karenia_brevis.AAC.1